jgi:hypothetical protein
MGRGRGVRVSLFAVADVGGGSGMVAIVATTTARRRSCGRRALGVGEVIDRSSATMRALCSVAEGNES